MRKGDKVTAKKEKKRGNAVERIIFISQATTHTLEEKNKTGERK